MKIYVLVSLGFIGVAVISAASYESRDLKLFEEITDVSLEHITRQRRRASNGLTVDGFTGKAACLVHCMSKSRPGGHCNESGVCVCQDTIYVALDKLLGQC